jgi:ribosomal protein S17E
MKISIVAYAKRCGVIRETIVKRVARKQIEACYDENILNQFGNPTQLIDTKIYPPSPLKKNKKTQKEKRYKKL